MQWQSLLKDLMTTGVEINEEGEVVWSIKNLIVFHAISEYSTAYQKKTVTNKTSVEFTKDLLRNSYNPTRWFEQIKRNVSFDVTTQFNSNQQSIAIYNSHIFNGRNATINDQRSTTNDQLTHTEVFSTILALGSIFILITCTVTVPIVVYLN